MGGNGMEDILMLYYEINNIYLELYKMELDYDKDNSMFMELISLLNDKRVEEKELFKKLGSCIDDDGYDVLCRLDEVVDNPFTKRIVDYMRFYNDNGDYAKLYVACTRNVYLIYLSFLQEYIDNREYESLRKGILSYKYYNSFICHDVEYSNIVNKFSIERDNYINLYMVVRMLKLDKEEVDRIIYECLEDTVIESIKKVLSISDIEYNDDSRRVISINTQCMLKAGLSMFSEREYELFKDKMFILIESLCTDKNGISVEIVNNIINVRKKSKSRIRKLSFEPVDE